jgi:hypothetical protein
MHEKVKYHHEIAPLSKSQQTCIIDNDFIDEYASTGPCGEYAIQREFKDDIALECNPPGGLDSVPFQQCKSHHSHKGMKLVPEIYYQITGIRADIRWDRSKKKSNALYNKNARGHRTITQWLGLQNSKYVALPEDWLTKNVPDETREEAWHRGMASLNGEEILPPGDARDDDPPESICCLESGLNHYYQGKVDNCVMGSFANAISFMMGPKIAQELLDKWVPSHLSITDR